MHDTDKTAAPPRTPVNNRLFDTRFDAGRVVWGPDDMPVVVG